MNGIRIGNTRGRGRGRGRGLPVRDVSDDLLLGLDLVTAPKAPLPPRQFEDADGDAAEITHAEPSHISKREHKQGRGKRRGSPKRKGKEWWKSLTNQRCPLSLKVSLNSSAKGAERNITTHRLRHPAHS